MTHLSGKAVSALSAGAGITALVTLARSRYASPYEPILERIDVAAPVNARSLAGLRIGFFTDPHLGPTMAARDVERGLSLLFQAAPDLLLIGGDLICESPRYAPVAVEILGRYAHGAPLGAVAVMGNHDLSNDGRRLESLLGARGIKVLRNDAVPVHFGGNVLWIVGIDDALLGRPRPDVAFVNVPAGQASLVLWHEPDWAEDVVFPGTFLMLAGHSHGGQVRFPLVGPIATPSGGRRFVAGLNQIDGVTIYTSRGAGTYRPPLRFRCAPEVTLITLV